MPKGSDIPLKGVAQPTPGTAQLEIRLKVQPELSRTPEESFKPESRICCDCTGPVDDLIDAPWRHAEFSGKSVLAHAQRLQEFFQQDLAGSDFREQFVAFVSDNR